MSGTPTYVLRHSRRAARGLIALARSSWIILRHRNRRHRTNIGLSPFSDVAVHQRKGPNVRFGSILIETLRPTECTGCNVKSPSCGERLAQPAMHAGAKYRLHCCPRLPTPMDGHWRCKKTGKPNEGAGCMEMLNWTMAWRLNLLSGNA